MSEAVTVDRHADADAQRRRHRHLYRRLRHQCADLSYTVGAGHNTVSALAITQANLQRGNDTDGAGNAANLSLDRPDPERPADRYHHADHLVADGVACERRSQCRQDRHADAQPERGGDGQQAAPRRSPSTTAAPPPIPAAPAAMR